MSSRHAVGQSASGLEQVTAEMKKMKSFYEAHPLSFEIKYTYANEHDPARVLDSLSGRVEMSGASYHCWLDSVETIRNDRYNIVLFKEDRIMYLTSAATSAAANPLQMMQAALKQTGVSNCEVLYNGSNRVIRMFFREGAPYRQMEMTIDTTSGYLLNTRCIVKTALLMDPSDNSDTAPAGEYDEYAIVQARFEHYHPISANTAGFDERFFFYKDGGEFVTTPAYKEYKIFVGTPNL